MNEEYFHGMPLSVEDQYTFAYAMKKFVFLKAKEKEYKSQRRLAQMDSDN